MWLETETGRFWQFWQFQQGTFEVKFLFSAGKTKQALPIYKSIASLCRSEIIERFIIDTFVKNNILLYHNNVASLRTEFIQ